MMDESRQEIRHHKQKQGGAGQQATAAAAEDPINTDSNSLLKPLSIVHLQGGLWVVVFGLVLSGLAFFSEIVAARVRSSSVKYNNFPLTSDK